MNCHNADMLLWQFIVIYGLYEYGSLIVETTYQWYNKFRISLQMAHRRNYGSAYRTAHADGKFGNRGI